MVIWYLSAVTNILLALLLLFRGHYTRYRVLFASLIFEVFAFSLLFYTYHHFGTNSHQYAELYRAKKMITITFNLGIILEGFAYRNRCVRIPSEVYLSLLLGFFLLEKAQFTHISHIVHEGLRYSTFAINLWWTFTFREEAPNERRYLRKP